MPAVKTYDVSRPADPSVSHRVVYADPGVAAQAAQAARRSSSYKRNISTENLDLQAKQANNEYGEQQRRKRQAVHISLKELMVSMELGEHGAIAQAIGEKWSTDVNQCGGITRKHVACGKPSYLPHACDMPLCPWTQAKRARNFGRQVEKAWDAGLFKEPKFFTFAPPNVDDLTDGWDALGKVMTRLHRRKVLAGCRGGYRALETTWSERLGNWHPHAHELVDSAYIPQFPVWDIQYVRNKRNNGGRWKVEKKHAGLAREFTLVCQSYPVLASQRADFDINNPNHWYFIDMRRANKGAVKEIGKYVAKGAQVVNAGAAAVVGYMLAVRNRRMLQAFGTLMDTDKTLADMDPEERDAADMALDDDPKADPPEAPGECPYDDCPRPHENEWEHLNMGPPVGVSMERDPRTGLFRILAKQDEETVREEYE